MDAEHFNMEKQNFGNWVSFNSNSRALHANSSERLILLSIVSQRMNELESKETDLKHVNYRAEVWAEITKQFNEKVHPERTRAQVQNLYKNMKAKSRKYSQRLFESHRDGTMPPEKDEVSETLLSLLNSEQKQRRELLQKAAMRALTESGAIVNPAVGTAGAIPPDRIIKEEFESENVISHDVSQFLKQELRVQDISGVHDTTDHVSSQSRSPVQENQCTEVDGGSTPVTEEALNFQSISESPLQSPAYTGTSDTPKQETRSNLPATLDSYNNSPDTSKGSPIDMEANSDRSPNYGNGLNTSCSPQQQISKKKSLSPLPLTSSLQSTKKRRYESDENISYSNARSNSELLKLIRDAQNQASSSNSEDISERRSHNLVSSSYSRSPSLMESQILQMQQQEHAMKIKLLEEQIKGAKQANEQNLKEHELKMKLLLKQLIINKNLNDEN